MRNKITVLTYICVTHLHVVCGVAPEMPRVKSIVQRDVIDTVVRNEHACARVDGVFNTLSYVIDRSFAAYVCHQTCDGDVTGGFLEATRVGVAWNGFAEEEVLPNLGYKSRLRMI